MTYAVHHVDPSGSPRLEEFPSLDTGLARVEALRNDGEVSEVRVFKEIPIEVRAYYRAVALEEEASPEIVAPVPEPEVAAAVPEPDSASDEWLLQEPPSGAMVMGPTPVTAVRETTEPPPEPGPEHRRALFSRS